MVADPIVLKSAGLVEIKTHMRLVIKLHRMCYHYQGILFKCDSQENFFLEIQSQLLYPVQSATILIKYHPLFFNGL